MNRHAERRAVPLFVCCDPIRESCIGTDSQEVHTHARARARVTGYRQRVRWAVMANGKGVLPRAAWIVTGTTAPICADN